MKKLIERITRRGTETATRETGAPQETPEERLPANPQSTETTTPVPKPLPELPLFFMLSHLDDDGPVRLDGVKLGVCEVMGLEIDEPKLGAFAGALNALDFPAQLLVRQHPPRLAGMREKLQQSQPDDLPPQTRAAAESLQRLLTDLEAPRRHPRPALLRRVRGGPHRRSSRPAFTGRAVRPPAEGQAAPHVPGGRSPWRLAIRVRRGDAGRGGDRPPRRARRRPAGPLPSPGQVAPVAGPRLPARAHGSGSSDGPGRPRRPDTGGAGGEDAGVAEGPLRVGPVPLIQAGPHHVPRGGDRPGGHHPAEGRGAAGQGEAVSCVPVRHPPRQGRGGAQGDDPAGEGPLRRHPGQAGQPGLPPARGPVVHAAAGPERRGRVAQPGHVQHRPSLPLLAPGPGHPQQAPSTASTCGPAPPWSTTPGTAPT